MKKLILAAAICGLTSQGVFAQEGEQPELDSGDLSYMLGYDVGNRLADMEIELDYDRFLNAVKAAMSGEDSALSEEQLQGVRTAFNAQQQALMAKKNEERRKMLAEQAEKNKAAGEEFLAKNAEREGVMTTDSGLQYEVMEAGDGAKPAATDTVTVHYHGTLIDGTTFDSSYDRGQPATFALNRVIPGWTEGVQLMPIGAKYRFYVPADLGYGGRSVGETIGPNSTLIFDVELIEIGSGESAQ